MKNLFILLGIIGLMLGCQSSSVDTGGTGETGGWQSGNGGSYNGADHMWNGSNPNAAPAGNKPGTGP